jgi:restriction system protein
MHVKLALISGYIWLWFALVAHAATVDCNPPRSVTATAICNDPEMLALLRAEADALVFARQHNPTALIVSDQMESEFVSEIRDCAGDLFCISEKIKSRRVALRPADLPSEQQPPSTPDAASSQTTSVAADSVEAPRHSGSPQVGQTATITQPPPPAPNAAEDTRANTAEPRAAPSSTILLLIVVGLPLVLVWRRSARRARAKSAFWTVVSEHEDALARQYLKLVQQNAYGVEDKRRWEKELDEFIRTRVRPQMYTKGIKSVLIETTIAAQRGALDRSVESKSRNLTAGLVYHPKMTPLEFEQFCASILDRNGWVTNLTPGSGDKGVDIIARRGPRVLVIQCKLYTGPVGNKAVQEAHAAKAHIGANEAAVVTNREFTPQARQLAATTGTTLLHFTELAEL